MATSIWRTAVAAFVLSITASVVSANEGVTDTTILIGQTIGVTGQIAGTVKELNEGAHAYINQVNARGGIHGRSIKILTLDDQFDPALSRTNAAILIKERRVFALFQNRGTPHTEAIMPIVTAHRVPLVAPSTGAALFHTPVHPLIFNVRAKYQDEVIRTVQHFSTVGIRDIGMIHVDDSFGRDAVAGFMTAMATVKLTPSVVARFDRAKPDIAATVGTVRQAQPRALIIVGSATTTAEFIKAIRAKNESMILMTLSNNSSQAFIASLGAHASGVMVSQITPAPDLVTSLLGQEFKVAAKANGATMSYAAMEGFIAAKVLVEGLRRAGRNLTRDGFLQALESIRRADLGGVMVSYDAIDHTGSEFVELTMIGKGGRFIR